MGAADQEQHAKNDLSHEIHLVSFGCVVPRIVVYLDSTLPSLQVSCNPNHHTPQQSPQQRQRYNDVRWAEKSLRERLWRLALDCLNERTMSVGVMPLLR